MDVKSIIMASIFRNHELDNYLLLLNERTGVPDEVQVCGVYMQVTRKQMYGVLWM